MKKRIFKIWVFVALAAVLTASLGLSACSSKSERTSYDIVATLSEHDMTVSGTLKVDYVNNSESVLKEVKFHLYPNAYREGSPVTAAETAAAYPNGMSYGYIDISDVKVGGKKVEATGGQSQILTVPASVKPYKSVSISMSYTLKIPNARHRLGFYDGSINLGNWFPIACVHRDGEWDDHIYYKIGDPFFSECADYKVKFTFPEGYSFASTGNVEIKAGETTASFKADNVRDVAIVLTKNRAYSRIVDGITLKYFGKDNETAFLNTAERALETFGQLYGKYPYDSLCVVKTPFYTGGMEYPGIVFIADDLNESLTHEVIVHEIAHQWWYAVVGNDQITDAWMDEGLAEFSTTLFYDYNDDYGVTRAKRIADAMSSYMLYNESFLADVSGDRAMNKPLNEFTGTTEYTFSVYVKGQLMFETLSAVIGDANLIKGLKTYYKNNKFGTAKPDDLIGALEKTSGRELKGFFDSWLSGKVRMFDN